MLKNTSSEKPRGFTQESVIKSFPTIYKIGSKGEVRIWRKELGISPDGLYGHRTVSGIIDGAQTESGFDYVNGKNIGKSNETTSETQALAEIDAEYTKKLKTGYFRDIRDAGKLHYTKPMLATDWDKRKAKVDISEGVYLQPKLDGIRCIARADGLWTRTGKPITSCPHISQALARYFEDNPDLIFDGELYNHEFKDDFNSLVSMIRKAAPTRAEAMVIANNVQYHIYDIATNATFFAERILEIESLNLSPPLVAVETKYGTSDKVLDGWYGTWLQDGYEGQMVRLDALYEHKRSNNLMKRKEFVTQEFAVAEVVEGQGNWAGYIKQFTLHLGDGRTFGSGVRGNQAQLAELFDSGKCPDWATVRYFALTPDGIPRFPVVIDYGYGERKD